jgi:hypothetical protein
MRTTAHFTLLSFIHTMPRRKAKRLLWANPCVNKLNYCSLHSTLVHSYHATPCLACRKAKRLLWVNPCFNKLIYCLLPSTLFHSLPLSSFTSLRYLAYREALRVLRVNPCVHTTRKLTYCSLHFTLFHSLHSPPSGTSRTGKHCVCCGSTRVSIRLVS